MACSPMTSTLENINARQVEYVMNMSQSLGVTMSRDNNRHTTSYSSWWIQPGILHDRSKNYCGPSAFVGLRGDG